MYVTRLSIREFRCIARADLSLLYPDSPDGAGLELPNVNLLTGLNGGGKSTVLKALVAAALGARLQGAGFDATGWLRRGAVSDGRLAVDLLCHAVDGPWVDDGDPEATLPLRLASRLRRAGERLEREGGSEPDPFADDAAAGCFLVAYGPSRHATTTASQAQRPWIEGSILQRVASMLDERVTLQPLEAWLPGLKREDARRYDQVVHLLTLTIPPATRFLGKFEGDAYLFSHDDVAVPYGALSEGLRSHIAWIADLLHHLHTATPTDVALDDRPGVVLVDEIDQRLHPRWQLDVLSWLSAAFPRLQFVVTSHSPLLAGGLRPRNMAVLESHKDAQGVGASRPRAVADDVFGRSADGVLTSSYFDLASTRADPFRKHLRDLVRLVREGDAEAPLQLMRVLGDPRKMKPVGRKATSGGKSGKRKRGKGSGGSKQ